MAPTQHAIEISDDMLRAWPLPWPDHDGDKEARGRVLIVAGSRELPGSAVLAGTAALRAGAGKLVIATGRSVAPSVAAAVPEARVLSLAETEQGALHDAALHALAPFAGKVAAVLVGPGLHDEDATLRFVQSLLPLFGPTTLVLDTLAMGIVSHGGLPSGARALLTPHAGEMAHLTGMHKDAVLADPHRTAFDAAARWQATVAMKGAVTFIATHDGQVWRHEGGNVGLATSGSGDVLAGVVAGLAARGAPLEQAAAWGVALHARAGVRLAQRLGTLGYLARELPGEIPALMQSLRGDRER
jgi:hydroxyethylthiazole kinase-like uncharacterized protein yjeF